MVESMAKKKDAARQIAFRLPGDLADRLDKTARMLATDVSHLLRIMIAEKLPEYEARAKRARGLNGGQA
jgi:hypothetical protein